MKRITSILLLLLACLSLTAAMPQGLSSIQELSYQYSGLYISEVAINPTEVRAGQRVAIDVTVFNTTQEEMTCELELLINEESVNKREITVPAQGNLKVPFAFFPEATGHYNITAIIPGDSKTNSFAVVPHPILANHTVRLILALIFCLIVVGLIVLIGERRRKLGFFREDFSESSYHLDND